MAVSKSLERLATGRRINRSADDPSGMQTAERLSADQIKLQKKIEAGAFEHAFLGAREGAMSVVSDLLIDLQGVVERAANVGGLSAEERSALQTEADGILAAIDQVAVGSTFNGQRLLAGYTAADLSKTQRSVDDGQGGTTIVEYSLADLRTGGAFDLMDGDLTTAFEMVKSAVGSVATTRGAIGNRMKAIDANVRAWTQEWEGTTAAKSLIVDADYAAEVSSLVRSQILQQAAVFSARLALGQAAQPLALLQGA